MWDFWNGRECGYLVSEAMRRPQEALGHHRQTLREEGRVLGRRDVPVSHIVLSPTQVIINTFCNTSTLGRMTRFSRPRVRRNCTLPCCAVLWTRLVSTQAGSGGQAGGVGAAGVGTGGGRGAGRSPGPTAEGITWIHGAPVVPMYPW